MAQSSRVSGNTSGSGSTPAGLQSITRKQIGKLLDSLEQKYQYNKDGPIDCFFFQIQCPFANDQQLSQPVEQIKDETSKIVERFISDKAKELGTWYKVRNGWTLTYFLDAQAQAKARQAQKPYDFEQQLNEKVRLPLREELKEKHSSRGIRQPIVFMRVCKYTRPGLDDPDEEAMEVDD